MAVWTDFRHVLHRCATGGARFGVTNAAPDIGAPVHNRLPRTEMDVVSAAAAIDLVVPDACMPGVIATLATLDAHADTVLGRAPEAGR